MNRDGARKSIWQKDVKTFGEAFEIGQKFDTVIVGAGITGVSTALQLQEKGQKCLLIEASNVAFGTTGGTTAHLNNFFDTTYAQAARDFGDDNAKLLFQSALSALSTIKNNISKYSIDCDFKNKNAYIFALDKKQVKQLDEIVEGSGKVGHEVFETEQIPFPIPFEKAVQVPGQAQFHPVKYVIALCEAFKNAGGQIAENCRYDSHDKEQDLLEIKTSRGIVYTKNLVFATHIPPGNNIFNFTNAPYRSYAIAVKLNGEYPTELGYDLYDPYRYYRTHDIEGEMLMIAGGEDHKTGHIENTEECFKNLENYVREHFDVEEIVYSWSSQYYEPTDGLPYIGKSPGEDNIYVATGFRGNGMIFGTLSSQLISDLIIRNESEYESLFKPTRVKPIAGFSSFVKENADVAYTMIADKIFIEKLNSLTDIEDDGGKIVKYEDDNYAIYKEKSGKLHIVKSTCPHAKCEVRFNNAEKSWDCPCHGSRFGIKGNLLNAPATDDLPRIDLGL
ncbi:hypothetical protein ASG01_02700 [Chryseobacterium sp. Leaf180]|uniref:FAD-dependent oxidoreductase n=1 Tax=Chryseobacterium sp. Leaf180 TaxID=1736289 RepID=UPI0006F80778|nr:FAD-dependent oxidoreductase [Chryseobacterium sp. Leaf180]KQR94795.1 hypothetical protein ASG01_02700 [Chryseobacterium sp. Leaf180]